MQKTEKRNLMSALRSKIVEQEHEIAALLDRIAALEKERNSIMEYVFDEPPFDMFDGIDLHEEASINASAFGRDEANKDDYYAAFLTCISSRLSRRRE